MPKNPVFAAIILALTCSHAPAWADEQQGRNSELEYRTSAPGVAVLAAGVTSLSAGALGMRAGDKKMKELRELSIEHGSKRVQAEISDLYKDLSKPGDQVTLAARAHSSNGLSEFEIYKALAKLRATSNPGESHKLIVTQILPGNSKVDRILVGDYNALAHQLAKLKVENAKLSTIVEDKVTSAEKRARIQAWHQSVERANLLGVAKREGIIARELHDASEKAYLKASRIFSPAITLGIVGTVAGIVDLMITPHAIKATAQPVASPESTSPLPSRSDAAGAAR